MCTPAARRVRYLVVNSESRTAAYERAKGFRSHIRIQTYTIYTFIHRSILNLVVVRTCVPRSKILDCASATRPWTRPPVIFPNSCLAEELPGELSIIFLKSCILVLVLNLVLQY